MELSTLDRVLGISALVLVAAVVIPMLFDGDGVVVTESMPDLPATPELQNTTVPVDADSPVTTIDLEDDRWAFVDEVKALSEQANDPPAQGLPRVSELAAQAPDESSEQLASTADADTGKESPLGGALAVQVGTFRDAANARGLRDALQRKGFHALLAPADDDMTRVLIGPLLSRAEARSVIADVEAQAIASLQASQMLIVRLQLN